MMKLLMNTSDASSTWSYDHISQTGHTMRILLCVFYETTFHRASDLLSCSREDHIVTYEPRGTGILRCPAKVAPWTLVYPPSTHIIVYAPRDNMYSSYRMITAVCIRLHLTGMVPSLEIL
nr:hypothetical protein CFP56_69154 [Quercus suber]